MPPKSKDKYWAYTYLDERGVPGIKKHFGSVGGIFIACQPTNLPDLHLDTCGAALGLGAMNDYQYIALTIMVIAMLILIISEIGERNDERSRGAK
jgi:hypothetical protein